MSIRLDHRIVATMIEPHSKVLDIGCGDGALLSLLIKEKNADGRGLELTREGVNACVGAGLPVIQGNADTDLGFYPDDAFDYVILSQTLQATYAPKDVLRNLLRIGRKVVVSFPNFGHVSVRWNLLTRGRMPVTESLPYKWYDTPNIHFCTIADFVDLTRELNAHILKAAAINSGGRVMGGNHPWWVWNALGEQGIFLLSR